jgi:hypothetical protein
MDAPSVAVSPDGKKLAVAWMDGREGERAAWLRLPPAKEIRLRADPSKLQEHPQLAMDASGGVWVVWEEASGRDERVYGLSPGAQTPVLLSGEEGGRFPVVAWSEKTGAIVAYETSEGVQVRRWPQE